MGCVTYELASKGRPPYHDHGSFHAMTLMSTRGAPHLASPIDPLTKSPIIQWYVLNTEFLELLTWVARSTEIESFLELCFQNNPYFRATASQLLTNPFLLNEDGWSQDLRRKLEVVFIGSSLRRSGLLWRNENNAHGLNYLTIYCKKLDRFLSLTRLFQTLGLSSCVLSDMLLYGRTIDVNPFCQSRNMAHSVPVRLSIATQNVMNSSWAGSHVAAGKSERRKESKHNRFTQPAGGQTKTPVTWFCCMQDDKPVPKQQLIETNVQESYSFSRRVVTIAWALWGELTVSLIGTFWFQHVKRLYFVFSCLLAARLRTKPGNESFGKASVFGMLWFFNVTVGLFFVLMFVETHVDEGRWRGFVVWLRGWKSLVSEARSLVVLVFGHLRCVVTGWSAFLPVLVADGVYFEFCST